MADDALTAIHSEMGYRWFVTADKTDFDKAPVHELMVLDIVDTY